MSKKSAYRRQKSPVGPRPKIDDSIYADLLEVLKKNDGRAMDDPYDREKLAEAIYDYILTIDPEILLGTRILAGID